MKEHRKGSSWESWGRDKVYFLSQAVDSYHIGTSYDGEV